MTEVIHITVCKKKCRWILLIIQGAKCFSFLEFIKAKLLTANNIRIELLTTHVFFIDKIITRIKHL